MNLATQGSSDTGFKFDKGSSRYFIVTLLLVTDPLPLHAAVEDLRRQLGYREDHEFKFYGSHPDVRGQFMRMLRRHDLLIRALVVDKHLITRPEIRNREAFYSLLVRMLLAHDGGRLSDASLILDPMPHSFLIGARRTERANRRRRLTSASN